MEKVLDFSRPHLLRNDAEYEAAVGEIERLLGSLGEAPYIFHFVVGVAIRTNLNANLWRDRTFRFISDYFYKW